MHDEDPFDERECDCDDRRLDDGRLLLARPQAADEQDEAGREERVPGQVEDVGDGRHGRLAVPDERIEVEEDVADAEGELSGAEEVPRQRQRRPVSSDRIAGKPDSD